ncbi:uncharacterized protein TA03090 [Theileria annulata]|uniref:Uncharacterized protein n=1 Tax=Theileria annulata TaxID=5874 RepID=Q4UHF7_THEAN|nr:uncharacterized protein TA03090 [Theileria annulata]CAI73482.1 hypothetical protein TA03090 [Theileria annulata]|eukprot:XP_954159.1 hypothetical protein TA03090 [Theileria annulata]
MDGEIKLMDLIDTVNGMNDVESVKSYCLSIISTLQKELQNRKSSLCDIRLLGDSHEKAIENNEILELKAKLDKYSTENTKLKEQLNTKQFSSQSVLGRYLIDKVRLLKVENEELSKALLENHIQPLFIELNKEKELNKLMEKRLKELHVLNVKLRKDNSYLSHKSSDSSDSNEINFPHSINLLPILNYLIYSLTILNYRKREESTRKSTRDRSSSYSRNNSRSKRSLSPKRRSSSTAKSSSPKRKERSSRPSPYSKPSDKQSSYRSNNSNDKSKSKHNKSHH